MFKYKVVAIIGKLSKKVIICHDLTQHVTSLVFRAFAALISQGFEWPSYMPEAIQLQESENVATTNEDPH